MVCHVSIWRDRWGRSRQADMVALEGRNNSTRVGDWRAAERKVWRGPESAGHWLRHVKQGRGGHGGQEWREEKVEGEVNVGVDGRRFF
jgi:hypothetical protein